MNPDYRKKAEEIVLGDPCRCLAIGCRGSIDEQIRGYVSPIHQDKLIIAITQALQEARIEGGEAVRDAVGRVTAISIVDGEGEAFVQTETVRKAANEALEKLKKDTV